VGTEEQHTHNDGWVELEQPRISPGKGGELGLFARGFTALMGRLSRGRTVNIFGTLGRHRRLFRPWLMFASRLMPRGTLPRADTEIVILRVALNCRARYEWEQHQGLARRAGLTSADIERIRDGSSAKGWTPRQAAILAVVDELHADRFVSDEIWARASEHLPPEQMIELCMLTGHYEMIAMTLNSAGVQVEPVLLER
jgi:alkylhydroperoxidase family enzyme